MTALLYPKNTPRASYETSIILENRRKLEIQAVRGHKTCPVKPIEARFWAMVGEEDSDGCRIWMGARGPTGYGSFERGTAHRFAYSFVYGAIPPGRVILHTCDRPDCVNPAHLSPGTHADNTADMMQKGRWNPGTRGGARLSREQVAAFQVNLPRIKADKGLRSVDCCHLLAMRQPQWSLIETGKRSPSLAMVTRIATALGVTAAELLAPAVTP